MIVTTQKPLDEIIGYISPYRRILIAGCDGCTQPPRGLKESETMSQILELAGNLKNIQFQFKTTTIAKQCDSYLLATNFKPLLEDNEAILSMACGIGIQQIARVFPDTPVFPAQNTHFMGAEEREGGFLEERCGGCGDCKLGKTGGFCPVVGCSKGLLTGACGGSRNGKCELSQDKDCGWILIYDRLKKLNKLDLLKEKHPPRDYLASGWRIKT